MYSLAGDVAEQHRHDLLREAAHLRLVAEANAQQLKRVLHASVLAWLGEQLVAWGWRLRARYGAVEQEHAVSL